MTDLFHVLRPGMKGKRVVSITYKLSRLTDPTGEPYCNRPYFIYCDHVETAVRKLQRWCQLPETGKIDQATEQMICRLYKRLAR